MPLKSSSVGTALPTQQIEVTPRMALAYAAGIQDVGLHTFDDADTDRFVASPFLCVSLEWQLVIAIRNEALGLTPQESLRAVHAGQDTRFHQPIKPGITVNVSGTIDEVRQTRAGALSTTRIEIADAGNGTPYATTKSTGLYRGVSVEGEDRCLTEQADAVSGNDEFKDDSADWSEKTVAIDRWFPHRYTECADIWNPIHTERQIALAAGLPDIIVHGTALWAIAGREVLAAYGGSDPNRMKRLAGRFAAMVIPGTEIVIRHVRSLVNPNQVFFAVLNAEGAEAVANGRATIE